MKKIHLFTVNGSTYTFYHCSVVTDNETMLVFRYIAASDGAEKIMHAIKSSLAGYSMTTDIAESL